MCHADMVDDDDVTCHVSKNKNYKEYFKINKYIYLE